MVTLRYTANGDYSDADSRALTTSVFTDLSHDLSVSVISGGGGVIRDDTANNAAALEDASSGATDVYGGVYADFSDVLGRVYLSGGDFGDVLIGGQNDDLLFGNKGNDVLEGGAGADSLNGGAGFDTVSYAHSAAAVTIDNGFVFAPEGDAVGDSYASIEAFIGSDFDDTFSLPVTAIFEGGRGADRFIASGGMTVSYEHSDDGVYVDLSGVTASTGGDAEGDSFLSVTSLLGSHFADTLIGTDFNDVLRSNGGSDTITGGAGDDTIAVTGKWASIDGGDGVDRLFVRAGAGSPNGIVPGAGTLINVEKVVVASGTALDLSEQSAIDGSIKVNSRAGDLSTVFGTQYDDRIVGGAGSDFLAGAGGHDRLSGGQGSDIFGFFALGQQGVITDFSGHNGDQDKILLFGGTAPAFVETFSGDGSAEVRAETRAPGVQIVFFDYDGNGRSDASFRVLTTDALTADDFYAPPPFGGPGLSAGALAASHTFAEALNTHDIAGLI